MSDTRHRMKLIVVTVCIMSCCGNYWPSAQPQTTIERAATAARCVYRAVRTASLNINQVNLVCRRSDRDLQAHGGPHERAKTAAALATVVKGFRRIVFKITW